MDTVKVDITRLQLLNDRINQTLEALDQLRASVHGLQHSSAQPFAAGIPQQAIAGLGYGAPQVPFGIAPQMQPFAGAFGMPQAAGLQHTTAESYEISRWSDPSWVSRCRQAFPNLTSQVPPVRC